MLGTGAASFSGPTTARTSRRYNYVRDRRWVLGAIEREGLLKREKQREEERKGNSYAIKLHRRPELENGPSLHVHA